MKALSTPSVASSVVSNRRTLNCGIGGFPPNSRALQQRRLLDLEKNGNSRRRGSYFKGGLDEIAIYPRVLSAAEIADNFAAAGYLPS